MLGISGYPSLFDPLSDTKMDVDETPDNDLGEFDLEGGEGDEGGTGQEKKRRIRIPITPDQSAVLSEFFAKNAFPSSSEREVLGEKLGMTPRRVQVWFQNQRQARTRLARERETAPLDTCDKIILPTVDNQAAPPTASSSAASASPAVTNDGQAATKINPTSTQPKAPSARAGNLFPLVNPPKSKHSSPYRSAASSASSSGVSTPWAGPSLPPIVPQPAFSWEEFGNKDLFTPRPNSEGDNESLKTVSSGSSRGGHSTGPSVSRRSSKGVNLPPLSTVLGSAMPPTVPSSPRSTHMDQLSQSSTSPRPSISSSHFSSRQSIAPTIAPSIRSAPAASMRSSASLAPPQSIFHNPGHKTRPITDLIPIPKFLKKSAPVTVGGGPRRAGSNSILDAALATSQSWPRGGPPPGSRSTDVLDAAMSRRGTISATSTMQMSMERRASITSNAPSVSPSTSSSIPSPQPSRAGRPPVFPMAPPRPKPATPDM
ncbi:homeobox-domain-containing protein [Meredithblackwellia eburnea MCA 4105]